MKKLVSAFLIALAFFACGPLPQDQEAESAVGITAPDGYSVACISGFTRVVPHQCSLLTGTAVSFSATLGNVCSSFDLSSGALIVPLSTKFVVVNAGIGINAANAVAIRQVTFITFLDSGCVSQYNAVKQSIREFSAVADGTELSNPNIEFTIPIISQRIYYKASTTGGTSSGISISPIQYID